MWLALKCSSNNNTDNNISTILPQGFSVGKDGCQPGLSSSLCACPSKRPCLCCCPAAHVRSAHNDDDDDTVAMLLLLPWVQAGVSHAARAAPTAWQQQQQSSVTQQSAHSISLTCPLKAELGRTGRRAPRPCHASRRVAQGGA